MNATAFVVSSETRPFISAQTSAAKAKRVADAIGASWAPRVVAEGTRVSFSFHGHPRQGRVISGSGSTVRVRFQQASGPVERTISVEKITAITATREDHR